MLWFGRPKSGIFVDIIGTNLEYPPNPFMSDLTIPILFFIDGLVFAFLAFFAHDIGLDPNVSWGQSRFLLMVLGAGLVVISVFLLSLRKRQAGLLTRAIKSDTVKIWLSIGHIWLLIFLIYVWFITYGNWTTWNRTTSYYDQLATAFDHGQLNIDLNPGAALLAAPNPYDPTHRPNFNSEIWDMALYKGKLYLYWGPTPAALIAPLKLFLDKKITDNYLVFFFFSGLLVFNSLILFKLWRKFYQDASAWNLLACIPLVGLILPILWCLNSPRVYEAAVGGGQFFLMGGVFFALSAFEQQAKIDRTKLFLAGLFWVGSVGSRALNALSIIVFAGLIGFWIIKNAPRQLPWTKSLPDISALLIPLMAGGLGVAWYNWARFDSPLEFGFRYTITILDLSKQSGLIFQPSYLLPNLYVYLFQPFELLSKFPFVYPTFAATEIMNRLNTVAPSIYFAGKMTGLLFCAPFLLLGLVHFLPGFGLDREKDSPNNLIIGLLAGSFLVGFFSLMFFFFAQMRYLIDVISQITLLAILGYWKIVSSRKMTSPNRARIFSGSANLLIVATICVSLLLSFSSDYDRFKTLNPGLYERISNALRIQP